MANKNKKETSYNRKKSASNEASVRSRSPKYTPTRGSDERKGGHNDPPKSPRPNKKPFAKKPKGD